MVRPIPARSAGPRALGTRARVVVTAWALVTAAAVAAACGAGDGDAQAAPATTAAQPPSQDASSSVLADAATDPVRREGSGGAARLVDARVVAQDGFDRVVFELMGDQPTVEVAYVDEPGRSAVAVPAVPDGAEVLSVELSGVQDRLVIDDDEVPTVRGLERIEGGGAPVDSLVRAGSDDDAITWLVVMDDRHPFQVDTLAEPNRVIVDIADR